MIQIVLVRWGNFYGPAEVNRLVRAVREHASQPVRFVCITDRPDVPCDPDVVLKPFPELSIDTETLKSGTRLKLAMFAPGILDPDLPTVYLDLDVMIRGDVARLAAVLDRHRRLHMLQSHFLPLWRVQKLLRPAIGGYYYFGNGSVLAFYPRDFPDLFARFNREVAAEDLASPPKRLRSDDRFMSYVERDRVRVFPKRLAVKFAEEFMQPLPALATIRGLLPWVRARRKSLVAISFMGASLKPRALAAYRPGEVVRYRHLRVRWVFDAISDYWRKPVT